MRAARPLSAGEGGLPRSIAFSIPTQPSDLLGRCERSAHARQPSSARSTKRAFNTFQRLVAEDVPDITLLTLNQFTIFNKRDHAIGAGGLNENFAEVWVDQ
jgi:hypothetical protein